MGRTGQARGWATLTGSGVTLFPASSCGTAPRAPARLQVMCPSAGHSMPGSQSCAHTLSLPLLTLCTPRAARAAPGFTSSLILPDHGRPVLDPGSEKCQLGLLGALNTVYKFVMGAWRPGSHFPDRGHEDRPEPQAPPPDGQGRWDRAASLWPIILLYPLTWPPGAHPSQGSPATFVRNDCKRSKQRRGTSSHHTLFTSSRYMSI